ncbi:MAG: ABC transporter ATP-binding protein [Acidimicrobiales bacterium]
MSTTRAGTDEASVPTPPVRGGASEPLAIDVRHSAPRSGIHPDAELGWLRRLLPVVREHRRAMYTGLVTGLLALVAQVAVPATARSAIDATIDSDRDRLTTLVLVLVGLAAARLLFGALYRYSLFQLAWGVETDLRALLYDHLTTLSFSYYDRTQSGQVISRANSDIRSIKVLLAFAPLIGTSILAFLLAFGFMLTIHVPLALISLSTLPGVYLAGQRLRNTAFPLTWVSQARMAELATIVDENINGTRVVKAFGAEERQIGLLASAAEHLRWTNVEAIRARARYNPFIEALPRVGMALVLLYGGSLAIDGAVSIGTLFAFSAYVIMLQAPFRMFGFVILQAQRASASASRIYEVLDERPEIVDVPGAPDLAAHGGRIEFRNVHFRYPSTDPRANDAGSAITGRRAPVLTGFDLQIEPGETVAIVGRTGSGKSTLARLLTRFYDVDGGEILIDGQRIDQVGLVSLRDQIGLVFDEPFLFSTSVRDNIAYGRPSADIREVVAAAESAQAHEFISALSEGYDTVVGERGYTLSGGQRQRIAIARTLLENPPILVLDDATSAIDVKVEEDIHQALRSLLDQRTTLLIAHRLSTIALAQRVVLLEHGRIVAQGTHQELLATQPLYVQILAEAGDDDGDGDGDGDDDDAGATGESS